MMTYKKSFLLNKDIIHTVKMLSNEKAGELFNHILSYANGENPIPNDLIIAIVFEPIKQQLILFDKSQKRKEFHWNWKGGISPENSTIRNSLAMKYWRIAVFERDNYTCKRCKKRGGKLNAHHIKKFSLYPELRFDISNGLTFCCHCHKIIHSIENKSYGRK